MFWNEVDRWSYGAADVLQGCGGEVKVKFALEQAVKAQRERSGIALLFL